MCAIRKTMTNIDSIIKKKRHHFADKGPYSQAMVFPGVMYRCESSPLRRLSAEELTLSNCGMEKTLESPLDYKEVKPANSKRYQPWIIFGRGLRLKLKLQYLSQLMWRADSLKKDLDAGEDWRQKEKGMAENEIDSIIDPMDMNLSKIWGIVKDGGDWRAAVHGVPKSWIRSRDWTAIIHNVTLIDTMH